MNKRFAVLPLVLFAVGSANAALPASVSTALSDAGTDAAAALAIIFGVLATLWALKTAMRKTVGS